ncbi:MAG: hypothetical protein ABR991_02190 [Terracidiphilus sp.]
MTVKMNNPMPNEDESPKPPTADEIAELADQGADISRSFIGKGKMMPPITPETKEEGDGQED